MLHVFRHTPNGVEGAGPTGPVQVLHDGAVIGTTPRGGTYGGGTVFLVTAHGELEVLHQFTGRDGLYPDGCLIPTRSGDFYGTANGSHRLVFRINARGNFAIVHRFDAPGGNMRYVVSVKGSDGSVYSASGGNGGFRLLYTGERAAAQPEIFSGFSRAAPGVVAWQAGNRGGEATKVRTGSVSMCADAAVGVDGHIYRPVPHMLTIMRSIEPGDDDIVSDMSNPLTRTEDQRKLAGVGGQMAPLPGGDLVGITSWQAPGGRRSGVYRVSPLGDIAWITAIDKSMQVYLSPGLLLNTDGRMYGLVSHYRPDPVTLLQVTSDGAVSTVLSFPPQAGSPGPLTLGPDGALYGAFGSYGEGTGGAVFKIVRQR
ncbi:choice-of-anchor tandem repeat GloVer-containing protein [Rhodanobacter sp. FW106-PBR-R2A-1-13]|uniref:choice-of-anchor tandem repeat GloVer-containing protein n=1 Tax=Rhodanobacter sp. FW106-PBR-R2A-1-13 TaxID=3454845 RepID=UPI0034E4CC4D